MIIKLFKILLLLVVLFNYINANNFDKSQNMQQQSNKYSQKIQKDIDSLDDESRELFDEYKSVMSALQSQQRYNTQLENIISSQNQEKIVIENNIDKIEHTHKNIVPLMQNMIDALEKFVAIDTPFLIEERVKRVKRVQANLKRADISVSDKYRQVLEAYKIENDYARSIESYGGSLKEQKVQFLRIGRVGLYYQTLDFKQSGMYDKKSKKFILLDTSYNKQILQAIKIAKKQLAPDLLILPLLKDNR